MCVQIFDQVLNNKYLLNFHIELFKYIFKSFECNKQRVWKTFTLSRINYR